MTKDLERKLDELFQLSKELERYTDGVVRMYNGIRLYPSEIHLLVFIAENPSLNVTEIAAARNISKGALSKVLEKLVSKNLIEKYNMEGNSKNIYFLLTEYGKQAYQGHLDFHEKHNRKHSAEMSDFLLENRDVIDKAIDFTKAEIQEYIKELQQEE